MGVSPTYAESHDEREQGEEEKKKHGNRNSVGVGKFELVNSRVFGLEYDEQGMSTINALGLELKNEFPYRYEGSYVGVRFNSYLYVIADTRSKRYKKFVLDSDINIDHVPDRVKEEFSEHLMGSSMEKDYFLHNWFPQFGYAVANGSWVALSLNLGSGLNDWYWETKDLVTPVGEIGYVLPGVISPSPIVFTPNSDNQVVNINAPLGVILSWDPHKVVKHSDPITCSMMIEGSEALLQKLITPTLKLPDVAVEEGIMESNQDADNAETGADISTTNSNTSTSPSTDTDPSNDTSESNNTPINDETSTNNTTEEESGDSMSSDSNTTDNTTVNSEETTTSTENTVNN